MSTKKELSRKWEVLEFVGKSSEPKSIKRLADGVVFSIGDYVTNGTKMKEHIKSFEYSFEGGEVFVSHDWSGVGMNLASLKHTNKLPSRFQIGEVVDLDFDEAGTIKGCEINKIHFSESKVLYDVIIHLNGKGRAIVGDQTRLYNVDSVHVKKP